MKLLSFSGGATKLAGLAAHGSKILEFYKPDVIAGISAGSLILLPMLLNKHRKLKEVSTNLKFTDIFDKVPVNEQGNITLKGYFRGLTTGSFGSMNNLRTTFKSLVSEQEFNLLTRSRLTPLILVGVTNATKHQFELIEINKLKYEQAIDVLIASSTIPIYCPPIKIGEHYFYDGGLKEHNPATAIIRKYKDNIKECISVYSRQADIVEPDWGFNGKYLGRNLSKTIDLMQKDISFENQNTEKELCALYGVKLTQKFSPEIMKGVYDIDNNRLKELYNKVIKSYNV
jgi:predicted acylesterase/phospholipase RssA